MKKINILLILILTIGLLQAKEPGNWFVGFGVGAGISALNTNYSNAASDKSLITSPSVGWSNWAPMYTTSIKDTGVTYEFIGGYKHYLNDYVGFRYYANIGAQHYKENMLKATMLEYGGNIDLLVDFYSNNTLSVGLLAGIGVGGVSFFFTSVRSLQ